MSDSNADSDEVIHFKIVTTSWNCMEYLPRCLESIHAQNYTNYEVCVVDDASDDPAQAEFIRTWVRDPEHWRFCSMLHTTKRCNLQNQIEAIRYMTPDPENVIVFLDGDDRFAHNDVLRTLKEEYTLHNCVMTYGNYEPDPPDPNCPRPRRYPQQCEVTNDYRNGRQWGIQYNHLRTMKYKLIMELDDAVDFKDEQGNWYTVAGDSAVMIPCLELAGGNYRFINETLVYYTSNSPLADWRNNPRKIDRIHDRIFKHTPRKAPKYANG